MQKRYIRETLLAQLGSGKKRGVRVCVWRGGGKKEEEVIAWVKRKRWGIKRNCGGGE